ncbi:MAG: prephenate dehydrogenase/arogenate dehydrogenase family protein [Anaerolineales bacterium]
MPVALTIIGLGKIGASVGLALAGHRSRLIRTGHDRQPEAAQKARARGAVDRIAYNLPAAVAEADVVLLALPADQIRPTLEVLAADLREDGLILDVSPIKKQAAAWVRELLPPRRHYLGLMPAFSVDVMQQPGEGLAAARPDLFRGGLMAIAAPPGTPGEALALAADLTALLGARPFFADLAELDGVAAAGHLLPQLTAAALVEAGAAQPGWGDIRKLAGRPYASATEAALAPDSPAALAAAVLGNRADALRLLDDLIAVLRSLRAVVAEQDVAALAERLAAARAQRQQWWQARQTGVWDMEAGGLPELPRPSAVWKRELGALLRPPRKRQP